MILTILIILNSFIYYKYFYYSATFLPKIIIFNNIIYLSYLEVDLLIFIIEKYAKISLMTEMD